MFVTWLRRTVRRWCALRRPAVVWTGALGLLGQGLAGCLTEPALDEGLAPESTGVVSGEAVVLWPLSEPAPIILLMYRLEFDGNGQLIGQTFADATLLPAEALDEGGLEGGGTVRTAPFTFPLVTPGVYVVSGLVDVDENFYLADPALAIPTPGDVLGGYADLSTGALLPIYVEGNAVEGEISVLFAGPPVPAPTE